MVGGLHVNLTCSTHKLPCNLTRKINQHIAPIPQSQPLSPTHITFHLPQKNPQTSSPAFPPPSHAPHPCHPPGHRLRQSARPTPPSIIAPSIAASTQRTSAPSLTTPHILSPTSRAAPRAPKRIDLLLENRIPYPRRPLISSHIAHHGQTSCLGDECLDVVRLYIYLSSPSIYLVRRIDTSWGVS